MASVVDISNIALSHIGAEAQITSISPPDGTAEAGLCARFYPIARKEMLEGGEWAFATTRSVLAEVANVSEVWRYAYAVPAGMVRALRVLQLQYVSDIGLTQPMDTSARLDDLFSERGSANFEIEGQVLYTNEPEAVLKYVVDVVDTTRFSALFTSALSMLLASYLAGPIIKGVEGANIGGTWRQNAYAAAAKASASNANSSNESAQHIAEQIRARA